MPRAQDADVPRAPLDRRRRILPLAAVALAARPCLSPLEQPAIKRKRGRGREKGDADKKACTISEMRRRRNEEKEEKEEEELSRQ